MKKDHMTLVLRVTWSNLLILGAAMIIGMALGVSFTQSYCNEHLDYASVELKFEISPAVVEPPPVTRL